MKKRSVLTTMAVMVLVSALLTSCVIRTGAHRGKQVTRNLRVSDFERIHITGNFDVVYEQGDSVSVCVEGKERLIEASDIRVEDGTLVVKMKALSVMGFRGAVRVIVTTPDLTEVNMTGNGEFVADGHVDTDHLTVSLTGNGDIRFSDLICDRADLQLTGNGDVVVKGLTCGYVNMQLTGNGDITVEGTTRKMDMHKAGNGDINMRQLKIVN